VSTGSPGAEGSLLAGWQAHDPGTEGETGARAATSLANWMVLSGRPDQALTWADRAVSGTVPGSALRAMARTAQAYAFAAASRSPEGLAALGFLPVSAGPRPDWRCSPGAPRGAARGGLPSGQHQGVRALPAVQRRRDHRGAGKLFGGHQLGPWTGFAVLCGYAVVLTGLAAWRLRRRDA
jgi:hypothetical protein